MVINHPEIGLGVTDIYGLSEITISDLNSNTTY